MTKSISGNSTEPADSALAGDSRGFARRGAENAANRVQSGLSDSAAGVGWRRSTVFGSATLGATVAMAVLAYYIVRKVRQQEKSLSPTGGLTVDDVRGREGHQIETMISATDRNTEWAFSIAAEAMEYWRQSLDDSYAFIEKLTRAQRLDGVIEVQSEFAGRAYSNILMRSFRVVDLCSKMTRRVLTCYLSVSGQKPKLQNVLEANPRVFQHNEKDEPDSRDMAK
ncbi:phasin family protein [Methylocystis echinoides]|uniref:phasin family protein n=1 Tax=Methylocystis echinoides TaxID=29468 RepID=UPI00343C08F1